MYLRIFCYNPNDVESIEYVGKEIDDFHIIFPQYENVKVDTYLIDKCFVIHYWYKEK